MLTPHCPLPAELRLSSEQEDLTPALRSELDQTFDRIKAMAMEEIEALRAVLRHGVG